MIFFFSFFLLYLHPLQFCNNYNIYWIMIKHHQTLTSNGIRPSIQRVAILDYLHTHRTHPTVDEVYESLHPTIPTLSRTTIYNTLKLFESKGVIQVLHLSEQQVHLDADVTPHAHFYCNDCGSIFDIPIEERFQAEVSQQLQHPHLKSFHISNTQVIHNGLCSQCVEKNKTTL